MDMGNIIIWKVTGNEAKMIRNFLKKIIFKEKATSESYIQYLRKLGMSIGEDCTIYAPKKTIIDQQYPWLITIGNHVRITEGVILLTHDYSWSVLKQIKVEESEGAILGASGEIVIGNNVFIGMNSIVLRGTYIGDNVIIGAGSVVSKDCEAGWVYAGNPARKIISVEEFYKKRKLAQLKEAKLLAQKYYERYRKKPDQEIFHEYFMLFENEVPENEIYTNKMELGNNYTESCNYIKKHNAEFQNFAEFLKYCFEE